MIRKLVVCIAALLAVLSVVLIVLLYCRFAERQRQALRTGQDQAQRLVAEGAQKIDAALQVLVPPVEAIVKDLESGALAPARIPEHLREALSRNTAFEMGVAFAPFAYDPDLRLFAPHVMRPDGKINSFQLETRYDYTQLDWYKDTIARGSAGWIEPYFGKAAGTLVVGYVAPFRLPGATAPGPSGVVRVNLTMRDIRQIVSRLSLGKTGYGFLISRKGVYLSDPVEELVRKQRNILDVAREKGDGPRTAIAEKALRGEQAMVQGRSGFTNDPIWLFSEPVRHTGWSLGAAFFEEEVALRPQEVRRGKLGIAYAGMLFLGLLSLLGFRVNHGQSRHLWYFALSIAAIFVAGLSYTWYLTLTVADRETDNTIRVIDQTGLQKFLDTQAHLATAFHDNVQVVTIPTGFFLQTVRFPSANDVLITGYAWQKYRHDQLTEFSQGLIFPDAESTEIKETYRREDQGVVTIGYYVKATIRQSFQNSLKYPFDQTVLTLRMWHKDFDKNTLLTPDLEAYQLTSVTALPGVEKTLVLPGWQSEGSYFSYVIQRYNANFGVRDYVGQDRSPELCFNLILQRKFLDPFISTLLPILVVAGLLFTLMLACTKIKEKITLIGFKATDILRAAATLLFPIIIAQINLRGKIAASGFIYMEYFRDVLLPYHIGVLSSHAPAHISHP